MYIELTVNEIKTAIEEYLSKKLIDSDISVSVNSLFSEIEDADMFRVDVQVEDKKIGGG